MVGYEGVDKRCDVLATAIRAGMTAYDLTELNWHTHLRFLLQKIL
ncbi:MAG: hypothetical protein ACLVKJ_00970 [Acutalibacteraceae bacterium]